ncbi:MAG: ABC transporter permease [Clostridiales bacterium]|jgi:ABC-2 type transport system permease protein|nr:ABC transporter permease [Clostridiales bacterium]
MRSVKAIFKKQIYDTFKNKMILVQFILFPVLAAIMTELVAKADENIPNSMFVTMFGAMFAGMTLLIFMTGVISEDAENKSTRLLVMAGVKPHEYLIGVSGAAIILSVLVITAFGFIGGFSGTDFLKFTSVLMLGSIASLLIGASVGMLMKNQQAAVAVATPVAMLFAFCPMLANFNEDIKYFTWFFYTRQIDIVVNNFSADYVTAVLTILGNIAVFLVLFTVAYKVKGLRA